MFRRLCLSLLGTRSDARMAFVAVLFVAIFRFVAEFNVHETSYAAGLFHALGDSFVFYTTTYFIFASILQLLIPGRPTGITAVVSIGLLFGALPPVLEALFPALGGRYYDYMFEWQLFFYDPKFQPLAETAVVWATIALTGLFVGVVTSSLWRGAVAFLLAWLGLLWLGVLVPSFLIGDSPSTLAGDRRHMTLVFLATSGVLFHLGRIRAHWPCIRRMNHALPFGALAMCGSSYASFDWLQTGLRAALILYLCLVLLLHNDYYDHAEDRAAARPSSSDASDVVLSTLLSCLALITLARYAPMVAMCASGMLLLGFAYHHPAFRLKENFCLSYKVEGGWALCAFCTGVSGPTLFASAHSLAWPCLLVFGGGALVSIPKDWKDVASDRLSRIPTLYVRLTNTPEQEQTLHRRVVAAVGLGMSAALVLVAVAYGFSVWVPALALLMAAPLFVLQRVSSRSRAVEVFLTLLGLWLAGASFLLRDVLA